MAEPTNTPVPGSTPRSTSPVHPQHTTAALLSPLRAFTLENNNHPPKLRVLHIGDDVCYNLHTYAQFASQFDIVQPSPRERSRPEFARALADRRWGDFHAVFRPFWGSGGEMGRWDRELIDLLPQSVRLFACAGSGFDWADTQYMAQRGILYCNAGLAAAEAVADFAVALVISTFRQLPYCMASAVSADPDAFQACHVQATAQSHNLRGHALGLVGLGNIGQQIASRLHRGFAMDVHYYDVVRKPAEIESMLGATYHAQLDSLLRASDCVVLCTPAAGETTIINAESLRSFRPGARFVNIARGSLVDEEALVEALERNMVSAAAIDVHQNEPNVHSRLRELALQGRVMLTCHNAGGTVETHRGFEELSMRNIMAVLSGGQPLTPVNLDHLPK
ncbi:D-isomer specific 2-hydroxyacid dehydrogenase [Stachybotrys elegans]|uniref:D-isomer specific 2-hydroxyacid dehydrogenase n=1 Tax=Stachybotrys elegans TaxID=80388 RepID=A0A8K0SQZ6_9HYPO|nr:D-isomer specific 2-hydroxyacid dehydrogenase [Stachybotrys elegans]